MSVKVKEIVLIYDMVTYAPTGVLYVANALEQAGYDVSLLSIVCSETELLHKISESAPLFVGFSVTTSPKLERVVSMSKLIKTETNVPVVWGGVHPTLLPEQVCKEVFVDYVIKGEGEELIVKLANSLSKGNRVEKILESNHFIKGLDNYRPAWHLVKLRNYLLHEEHSVRGGEPRGRKRIFLYMVSSRGCPYSCGFCYNYVVHKCKWRGHSAKWVKAQIDYIHERTNCDGLGLWDDNFWTNVKRGLEITTYLKKKDIAYLCECRADILTDSFVKQLKYSGCLQVLMGAESGSQRILDDINKKTTIKQYLDAIKNTQKYNLPLRISFIYGFPRETEQDARATINFIKRIKKLPHVSISGPKRYTPYPGTPLYSLATYKGFKPPRTTVGWSRIHREIDPNFLPINISKKTTEELDSLKED